VVPGEGSGIASHFVGLALPMLPAHGTFYRLRERVPYRL
jgi:hypothetical protein